MSGYGFAGHIGLAEETTWGSAEAAADYVEALSESLALAIDRFDSVNIHGAYYEPKDHAGLHRIAGDLVIPGNAVALGFLLHDAMGVSSGVVATGLISHTFSMANADASTLSALPSRTYEVFRDIGSSQQIAGGVVAGLQLSVAPNQALVATARLLAKSVTNIVKTTPSFPSSPAQAFTFDGASFQIGGAATAKLEAFTLSIDNQLEGVPVLNGSNQIAKIRRAGPQMVRVSGTLSFDDITELEDFRNQTERAFTAHFFRASSFGLTLSMPRVTYITFPTGMSGRGRQTVAFEGRADYHVGSGHAFLPTLKNVRSVY